MFVGFSSHHDRPSQVSARGVNANVHGHSCRPARRLRQCLWGDLGYLSQFVRGGLGRGFILSALFNFWRSFMEVTVSGHRTRIDA